MVAENEPYESGVIIINVSDLNDGTNNPRAIQTKLETALTLLQTFSKQRIVIQCRAGISRSPTIAAAVLALYKAIDFDTALNEVTHRIPRTHLNYDLVDSCREALKLVKN